MTDENVEIPAETPAETPAENPVPAEPEIPAEIKELVAANRPHVDHIYQLWNIVDSKESPVKCIMESTLSPAIYELVELGLITYETAPAEQENMVSLEMRLTESGKQAIDWHKQNIGGLYRRTRI